MTNKQYIEKIISSVDRILVDTSTLMSPGFLQFISNNKEELVLACKKLIIPKAVYSELARHLASADSDKAELALSAVELISLNKDIFQVENVPLSNDEVLHAFADAELLSELTIHKSNSNQLLLTNDKKLSCDAFDLNQQQSCKGCKVLVCYINWCGEMQCCDCARFSRVNYSNDLNKGIDTIDAVEDEINNVNSSLRNKNSWKFDWKSGAIGVSGIGAVYCILWGGKQILQYAK